MCNELMHAERNLYFRKAFLCYRCISLKNTKEVSLRTHVLAHKHTHTVIIIIIFY